MRTITKDSKVDAIDIALRHRIAAISKRATESKEGTSGIVVNDSAEIRRLTREADAQRNNAVTCLREALERVAPKHQKESKLLKDPLEVILQTSSLDCTCEPAFATSICSEHHYFLHDDASELEMLGSERSVEVPNMEQNLSHSSFLPSWSDFSVQLFESAPQPLAAMDSTEATDMLATPAFLADSTQQTSSLWSAPVEVMLHDASETTNRSMPDNHREQALPLVDVEIEKGREQGRELLQMLNSRPGSSSISKATTSGSDSYGSESEWSSLDEECGASFYGANSQLQLSRNFLPMEDECWSPWEKEDVHAVHAMTAQDFAAWVHTVFT